MATGQELITIGNFDIPFAKLGLNPSQVETIQKASARIVMVSSRLAGIDREIQLCKNEIAKLDATRKLKEIKKMKKQFTTVVRDSTNELNGMMKAVLSEVPGETLNDKYNNLNQS